MSGCMASMRGWWRSSGQRYRAKTIPHAMRLNTMLIWNEASEGILDSFPRSAAPCLALSDRLSGTCARESTRLVHHAECFAQVCTAAQLPQHEVRYIGARDFRDNGVLSSATAFLARSKSPQTSETVKTTFSIDVSQALTHRRHSRPNCNAPLRGRPLVGAVAKSSYCLTPSRSRKCRYA